MKNLIISLSSIQAIITPSLLNGYIFADPIHGTSITYPVTADGNNFTNTTFPFSANGGLFFPWGYSIQNTFYNLTAGPLKGPYTIVFSLSNIDDKTYPTLKVLYDFDDGQTANTSNSIVRGTIINDPLNTLISHNYWPNSEITTYTPTITVVNSLFISTIYSILFQIYPDSIYEYKDCHLLNVAQLPNIVDSRLNIFELGSDTTNYMTILKYTSAAN